MNDLTVSVISNFETLPYDTRVKLPAIKILYSCSAATVWRKAKTGKIPRPRKEDGSTFWVLGEVRDHLRESGRGAA